MPKKNISFEDAMSKIEEIVYALENEEVSLEKSIELYKKGMEYAAFCRQRLTDAEGEVLLLKEKAGGLYEEPFEPEPEIEE